MQPLSQGQIVQAAITDPRGQNLKPRPVVILTATDELPDEGTYLVAAISTKFSEPLPADYIRVPWSHDGRAKSGLTEPSVVKCRWLRKVKREEILYTQGHLPSTIVRDIMRFLTQN